MTENIDPICYPSSVYISFKDTDNGILLVEVQSGLTPHREGCTKKFSYHPWLPHSFQFVCCYYHSKISVGQSSNLAILDNEGGGDSLGSGGRVR